MDTACIRFIDKLLPLLAKQGENITVKVQKILNEYRMDGNTTLQLRLVGVCMQRNLGNK